MVQGALGRQKLWKGLDSDTKSEQRERNRALTPSARELVSYILQKERAKHLDITDAHLHSKMSEHSEERPVAMNQREGEKERGRYQRRGLVKR